MPNPTPDTATIQAAANHKYILDGKTPVLEPDLMAWAVWFEGPDRIVAKTDVGEVHISTVFLGLDHSFGFGDEPLLFETMVFGGALDQEQERYPTWESAELGHASMVARVKAGANGATP